MRIIVCISLFVILLSLTHIGVSKFLGIGKPGLFLWADDKSMDSGFYFYNGMNIDRGQNILIAPNDEIMKEIQIWRDDFNTRLFKKIAGIEGDIICHGDDFVTISYDGNVVLVKIADKRFITDNLRNKCYAIKENHIFLLGTNNRSLDSRYFGQIDLKGAVATYTYLNEI